MQGLQFQYRESATELAHHKSVILNRFVNHVEVKKIVKSLSHIWRLGGVVVGMEEAG